MTTAVARENAGGTAKPVHAVAPRVEITENDKAIWLIADMPGVGTNGANVELNENILSLEGSVENSEKRGSRHYSRRFTLTDSALFDVDKITAKMTNGVLEVEIPKAAKPKPKQIKITAA